MATTTPNYGWDVPTSTDYVKDGATAIETLGDDIDSTLYTALGGAYPGLRLIKKQTIGSAVASVTVTAAFSATYENYLVKVVGNGSSASSVLFFRINGSTGTSYQSVGYIVNYASNTLTGNGPAINSNGFRANEMSSAGNNSCEIEIYRPFTVTQTSAISHSVSDAGGSSYHHRDTNAASSTDFTIAPSSGTISFGTIYVYGYGAS
jgi:hypothetical protein